eukprot:TRINITY_DN10605_c0_g1_i1.p1 TRINITY_DN10605_c0_g1~~TRINITY_DN10605_c0_g1_i1.p1  ORF type:complete len:511 (-),score=91.95 TRINITY_DN10605_c0_g1_i1:94-1626(-)
MDSIAAANGYTLPENMYGIEEYIAKLPNPGHFTAKLRIHTSHEIRVIANSQNTPSRGTKQPVVNLVIRPSPKITTLYATNPGNRLTGTNNDGGCLPCDDFFWLSVNSHLGVIVFGAGEIGQNILFFAHMDARILQRLLFIGFAGWKGSGLIDYEIFNEAAPVYWTVVRVSKFVRNWEKFLVNVEMNDGWRVFVGSAIGCSEFVRDHDRGKYLIRSKSELVLFVVGPRNINNIVCKFHTTTPHQQLRLINGSSRYESHISLVSKDYESVIVLEREGVPPLPGYMGPWLSIEIHSVFTETGLRVRIEHHSRYRMAGEYMSYGMDLENVDLMYQSAWNFLFATREILANSGYLQYLSTQESYIHLMGFETNNPLHGDYPPHFHIGLRGDVTITPHYYLDQNSGGITNNWQGSSNFEALDVHRMGEIELCIRTDGGLNIGLNGSVYNILSEDNDYSKGVQVWKDGTKWLGIKFADDTNAGLVSVVTTNFMMDTFSFESILYEPLTGRIIAHTKS